MKLPLTLLRCGGLTVSRQKKKKTVHTGVQRTECILFLSTFSSKFPTITDSPNRICWLRCRVSGTVTHSWGAENKQAQQRSLRMEMLLPHCWGKLRFLQNRTERKKNSTLVVPSGAHISMGLKKYAHPLITAARPFLSQLLECTRGIQFLCEEKTPEPDPVQLLPTPLPRS